jgi:hypothetical protein
MPELELTRTPGDRRAYALGALGTVRLGGLWSRGGEAEAGGRTWRFDRQGFGRRTIAATDAAGSPVGEFVPRGVRRGGTLRWHDAEYAIRPASAWRERYALADGDRELALLDGKGWGKRPVRVTIDDAGALDPGLLLFAAFVVNGLAQDASSAATAAA